MQYNPSVMSKVFLSYHRERFRFFLLIICAISASASFSTAQQKPANNEKTGLAAALADDEKLISELSRRELSTLRDYMFKKDNVKPEQQAAYLAVSSLKQLNDPKLSRKQQQELINTIALGIDRVLSTMNDPTELMKLNTTLIVNGTARNLNVLEYFGENPKVQYQLRPIAEAISRVYDKAITVAQQRADKIANDMTASNQSSLAPQWEKMTQLVGLAKFNAANHKHSLALSIDRADPRRAIVAKEAITALTEYEAPEYEIQAAARVGIGKLNLDIGTPESLAAAKKKFVEVITDPKGAWSQKFEAVYFIAVADVLGKDFTNARQDMAAAGQWLADYPPGNPDAQKGAEAALKMLEYRIFSAEAESSAGPAAHKSNEQAIAALQELLAKRPDLQGIINEQIITRLPDEPNVGELNVLLLKAIVGRGNDEVIKPADQQTDKKALAQAVAAAREIVRRSANDRTITVDDTDRSTLLLALFHARLGQDTEAANIFLDYIDKYKVDRDRVTFAFESAMAAVARLKRDQPNARATNDAYNRFLQIAVAPPFEKLEFAFEYGRLLLERNIDQMQGKYTEAEGERMMASAQKAAELFRKVPDANKRMHARFFEMLAYDQMIDLAGDKSPQVQPWTEKIQSLAEELNSAVATEISNNPDQEARKRARMLKVRAALLVANLATDDTSPQRSKSLLRAVNLLSTFEKDAEGIPSATALIGRVLFIRVHALLSLGRTDEALQSLGKYLETRSGDEGVGIVTDMLEALNKEFEQAEHDKNDARMAELAGHRARVSGYLVQRVALSKNPELKKLLPQYRNFEAAALQKAALLEKDKAKRKEYLTAALKIFQQGLEAVPNDRGFQLAVALAQFDLEDYAAAKPVLVKMLDERLLGKPMIESEGPDGPRSTPNNMYWEAMYKLLRSNIELSKAKDAGSNQLVEDTTLKLKQLYVQWGQPGGPRWSAKLDALRQEILPDWTPPPLTETLTTKPLNSVR